MLIAQRPVITSEKLSETRSKFFIEPLEPGFGYTLGNSLRRTLLSSIPGAAVTSVKIDGVRHEFETKEGVKEDVTDIILNIKELVVSSEINDPVTAYIKTDKPGAITAADIKVPAGIEVHNKDLHIATLSKGNFEMELVIERGRGYVSADDNKKLLQNVEVDRIVVDSIYSPVTKVSYSVDATRVGQHTNFDKLTIDVETKPSITPTDVMASAGKTLIELFGLVHLLNEKAEGVELGEEAPAGFFDGSVDVLDSGSSDDGIGLELLDLKTKAGNILSRYKIKTLEALTALTEEDILSFDGAGPAVVKNIQEALEVEGLKLAD